MRMTSRFQSTALSVIGLLLGAPCAMSAVHTEVPQGTAFPVGIVHSVDARKARPGDRITAKEGS
jgi:hypothetical protein